MSSIRVAGMLPQQVRMHDDVALHIELHRPDGDDGRRPGLTVVFLHGWTLDSRLWYRQLTDLPTELADYQRPLRLLTFDLRGHGRSAATRVHSATLQQLADDLSTVLREAVPHDRVVLVGHSLGGMALVEYAHRHPADFLDRVDGVVLVNSSAEGTRHTHYGLSPWFTHLIRAAELNGTRLLARFGAWHPHRHLMPVLRPGIRWLVFGRTADSAGIRLVADMVGSASLRSIGAFRPAINLHRRLDALAVMRHVPVTVLTGSADRLTPPSAAESIGTVLPHAVLRVLDHAGHLLPLECPDEVTDAVADVCRQALAPGGDRQAA